jgi:hypothetical protein
MINFLKTLFERALEIPAFRKDPPPVVGTEWYTVVKQSWADQFIQENAIGFKKHEDFYGVTLPFVSLRFVSSKERAKSMATKKGNKYVVVKISIDTAEFGYMTIDYQDVISRLPKVMNNRQVHRNRLDGFYVKFPNSEIFSELILVDNHGVHSIEIIK